jgi:probable phosphoglycerate mutase
MATSITTYRPSTNGNTPDNVLGRMSSFFRLDDADATELLLIRHAEPDYHAIQNGDDPWDPPLTERGRWQAMRLATRLGALDIQALYTSPLRRTRETAAFVATALDLPIVTERDLREVEFSAEVWEEPEGSSEASPAEVAARFLDNPRWDVLPGCESTRSLRRRVIQSIEAILARHPRQRVAIVAHGGVINAFLSMLLDIPRDMFFLPDHTSLSVVRYAGYYYAVRSLNDSAHLLPLFEPSVLEAQPA